MSDGKMEHLEFVLILFQVLLVVRLERCLGRYLVFVEVVSQVGLVVWFENQISLGNWYCDRVSLLLGHSFLRQLVVFDMVS